MSHRAAPHIVVIGAGHAGCEAALAAARAGCGVTCVTLRLDRVAHMPCNCSIGGPAKGQMVREIDALGGQMALAADDARTHARHVGTGKGPAIRTLRVHADKAKYPRAMTAALERSERIVLRQGEARCVVVERGRVCSVELATGERIACEGVVVTAGTFLEARMHCGDRASVGGRLGDPAVSDLVDCLRQLGLRTARFKTGTTPRVLKTSVDMKALDVVPSEPCPPFSFLNDHTLGPRELLPCWMTRTTERTLSIVRANLARSALYGGRITGVGPRYCPSIEDKVVRFPDREAHPVFLEQEEWDGELLYVQGVSTSLPEDVQLEVLRSLPGMDRVAMARPGYAVEYEVVLPDQLEPTLETRAITGLFLAGQVNGTSGYEEAAAQGLLAGANAARRAVGVEGLVLDRRNSYIGVMVDDLVTKGVEDPYRMLTSRAEHRLLLRHDNADERLTPLGREAGLVDDCRWLRFDAKRRAMQGEESRLKGTLIGARESSRLVDLGTDAVRTGMTLWELLRRPEVSHERLARWFPPPSPLSDEIGEALEVRTKFEGYIRRQEEAARLMDRTEAMALPPDTDYAACAALSLEGREKLTRIRPRSVGQAARIPGVSRADVFVLAILARRGAAPTQSVGTEDRTL